MKLSFGTTQRPKTACLHCGQTLGFGRFTGARYCSEEHAAADREYIEAIMLQRLGKHAERMSRYGSINLSPPNITSASDLLRGKSTRADSLAAKPVF